jgi:hypothetical protein
MRACDREMETCECCCIHAFTVVTVTQLCVVDTGTRRCDVRPLQPVRILVVRMKNETRQVHSFEFSNSRLDSTPQKSSGGTFVIPPKKPYC